MHKPCQGQEFFRLFPLFWFYYLYPAPQQNVLIVEARSYSRWDAPTCKEPTHVSESLFWLGDPFRRCRFEAPLPYYAHGISWVCYRQIRAFEVARQGKHFRKAIHPQLRYRHTLSTSQSMHRDGALLIFLTLNKRRERPFETSTTCER
jgi:hypothetical protein